MSDFIQDMKDATELFKKWGDTVGNAILDKDFAEIDAAMMKHYDRRNEFFENMLKILERSGDSLASDWQKICDDGLKAHNELNSLISNKVSGGMTSIGLRSFLEGESKIWQENHKATLATMAEVITQIGKNDDDIIKKLEEDLKKAREEGKANIEQWRLTMGDTKESVRNLTIRAAESGATKVVSEIPVIGEKLAPLADKAIETIVGSSEKTRDLSKRTRVYKDILIANRKMIDDVKDKINDQAIWNVMKEGVSFAHSLKDGATGDYKAADWAKFGEECAKRLNTRSEPAVDRAHYLYETVRPAYIEGLTGAFATLAGTQENLTALTDELDENTLKVFEELRKDDEVTLLLRDGPTKTTARATLQKIKDGVTAAIAKLKNDIKDAEENLRAGSF